MLPSNRAGGAGPAEAVTFCQAPFSKTQVSLNAIVTTAGV